MNNNDIKIEENIIKFIRKCGNIYGDMQREKFCVKIHDDVEENNIVSPIEQILYTALLLVYKSNNILYSEPIEYNGLMCFDGIDIVPQYKIDNYKVDFLIKYDHSIRMSIKENKIIRGSTSKLIVECDSQQWHDRTEKERRYEKQRERYLIKQEYKIFRYTGKEIIEKPFDIAVEIISYVSKIDKNKLTDYVLYT